MYTNRHELIHIHLREKGILSSLEDMDCASAETVANAHVTGAIRIFLHFILNMCRPILDKLSIFIFAVFYNSCYFIFKVFLNQNTIVSLIFFFPELLPYPCPYSLSQRWPLFLWLLLLHLCVYKHTNIWIQVQHSFLLFMCIWFQSFFLTQL